MALADDVPILGGILTASIDAGALSSLTTSAPFLKARARWLQLRTSNVPPTATEFETALRKLCQEAADALSLGSTKKATIAFAFGAGSLTNALFAASEYDLVWAGAGLVLLASGGAEESSHLWKTLHLERGLKAELLRFSRGRY